ncbi:MAG: glycosyltransferase family 2 protein, partial [Ilumatobacter sp.]
MIFLDGAAFIDEAIRSVVAQGDAIAWELVLVDDGSTDASTAIARRWADSDGRIRYLEHDGHANLGTGASRNAGLDAAHGEYVGFLDCDDVWLPCALSHAMRVLAHHADADAVFGGAWRWHSWTDDPADRVLDDKMVLPDSMTHEVIEPPELFADIYLEPDAFRVPAICSTLIDRASLLRVGGFEDSFRNLYEDQVLYSKIALQLRAVVDPRPLALYRQHEASACHVAIDAGEWQWTGPSEPLRHYAEWLRTYIVDNVGSDAASLEVVRRNLDRSESPR